MNKAPLEPNETKRKAAPATKEAEISLKGTFVSVMLLGAFLALTWLGVFFLFVHRY
ncbi:MAG TPA: cytochrome c oxidase subunit 2A [Bacilli bacterium]